MKFEDKSPHVKKAIEQAAISALTKAVMLVETQAVMLVPVDTGRLRGSIGYKVDNSELVGYVGTNCEYAIYIEYGTGQFAEKGNGRKGGWLFKTPDGKTHFTYGNRPQPYLRPAFRQNKKQIQSIIQEEFGTIGR